MNVVHASKLREANKRYVAGIDPVSLHGQTHGGDPNLPPSTDPESSGSDPGARPSRLVSVPSLRMALTASRAVGRLEIPDADRRWHGVGAGFLVFHRLLLTSYLALNSRAEAARAAIQFDSDPTADGESASGHYRFGLDPDWCFLACEELGFTLVGVKEQNPAGVYIHRSGSLKMSRDFPVSVRPELANAIIHRDGERKKIALGECKLLQVNDSFLHYQPLGSSVPLGSPVLNDRWEVVGMHSCPVPLLGPDGALQATDGGRWESDDHPVETLAIQAHEFVTSQAVLRRVEQELPRYQELLEPLINEAPLPPITPGADEGGSDLYSPTPNPDTGEPNP